MEKVTHRQLEMLNQRKVALAQELSALKHSYQMSSLLSLPSSSSQIGNTGGRGGVAGTNQYPPPSSLLYCFPDDHKPNQTASPHQVKNVIHTSASNTTYRPRAAWRPSGSPSRSLSATNSINLSMPTSPRSSQLRGIPSSSSIPSYQRSTAASSAAKAPTASISRTPRRHAASRVAMTEKRLMKVRDSVDSAAAEIHKSRRAIEQRNTQLISRLHKEIDHLKERIRQKDTDLKKVRRSLAETLKSQEEIQGITIKKANDAEKEVTELRRLLAGAHGNNKVLMEQVVSERKSKEKLVEAMEDRGIAERSARDALREQLKDTQQELKREREEKEELKRLLLQVWDKAKLDKMRENAIEVEAREKELACIKEDNESLRDRTKELRAELARLRRREQRLFADELHQGEASSALNAEAKKAQGENNHVHDTRGPSSTISSIPNDRMKGTVVTSSTAGNAHGHRTNKIRKKTVKAKHIPQEQRTQKARRAYLLNGGGPSFRPQASVTGKKGLQSKRRIGKMGRRNTISVGSGLSSWNRR